MSGIRQPIDVGRKICALTAAALTGLAGYVVLTFATNWGLAVLLWQIHGRWPNSPDIGTMITQMIFGPFVAVPGSLIVGLPVWHWTDHHLPRDRRTAMSLGAVVGATLSVAVLLLGIPSSPSYRFFVADYPTLGWWLPSISTDAHPGWNFAMDLIDLTRFAAAGSLASLVAYRTALSRW